MSNQETDPSDDTTIDTSSALESSRRKFIAAGTASWASVSLAGCVGGDDDDDGGADDGPNYVVTDDVVAGEGGIPEGAGGLISAGRPQRAFVPGMEAIFKIGVWDPETGDIVSDNTIDEATVNLDTGTDIDLEFFSTDREWSGDWLIPDDIDLGTVGYEVQVTNDGEFTGVGVAESELEIVEFDPQVANFVVTVDTISHDERGGGYVQSCLPQHNFTPDMAVGFSVGIYDGGSGDPVGDDVVDEATIVFEDGNLDDVGLEWDDEDEYWDATWRGVPDVDGATTLEFDVEVTNDGEFHNVGVYGDSVTIIPEPADGGDNPAANYVVTTETVAHDDRADGFVQSCLPQNNFTPDMAVGFDVAVWDGQTGDMVDDGEVDEVTLEFDDGDLDSLTLEFDDDDGYWGGTWRGVPDVTEATTISYEVQATNDGEFHNVGIYTDSIQVIPEP